MIDVSKEIDYQSYDVALQSKSLMILGLKEEYINFEKGNETTLREYTETVIKVNKMSCEISGTDESKYLYFTYEKTIEGINYKYLATTHKAEDGFWLVQAVTLKGDFDQDQLMRYMDTIGFP